MAICICDIMRNKVDSSYNGDVEYCSMSCRLFDFNTTEELAFIHHCSKYGLDMRGLENL